MCLCTQCVNWWRTGASRFSYGCEKYNFIFLVRLCHPTWIFHFWLIHWHRTYQWGYVSVAHAYGMTWTWCDLNEGFIVAFGRSVCHAWMKREYDRVMVAAAADILFSSVCLLIHLDIPPMNMRKNLYREKKNSRQNGKYRRFRYIFFFCYSPLLTSTVFLSSSLFSWFDRPGIDWPPQGHIMLLEIPLTISHSVRHYVRFVFCRNCALSVDFIERTIISVISIPNTFFTVLKYMNDGMGSQKIS